MQQYRNLNSASPGAGRCSPSMRKKCLVGIPTAVVAAVFILLGALSLLAYTRTPDQSHKGHESSLGNTVIKWICAGMLYPDVCKDTLSNAPGGATHSPKELATFLIGTVLAALNESSLAVNWMLVSNASSNYANSTAALEVCNEVIEYAQDQLGASLVELSGVTNRSSALAREGDIQTWLSASMNLHDTCIDELLMAGTSGYPTTSAQQPPDPVIAIGAHVKQLYSVLLRSASYLDTISSFQMPQGFPKLSGTGRYFVPAKEGLPRQNASVKEFSQHMKRLLLDISSWPPNATVDSTGNSSVYRTIQDAVNAAPTNSDDRYVIKILEGVYQGQINVSKHHKHIAFVGAGIDKTVITGSLHYDETRTTYRTATLAINGEGFLGTEFTVKNTAGPENHQAVALRVSADKAAFYKVKVTAFQDTLYAHSHRQFFSECYIEGTVDFIFGDSSAVFQNCNLVATTGLQTQQNIFTAQGRSDPNQNTGFVFQNCTLSPSASYSAQLGSFKSYLGRPWKNYSRTIFVDTYMESIIAPEGWLSWLGAQPPDTVYYAEFRNRGPGSNTSQRVNWTGVHQFNDSNECTTADVIFGDSSAYFQECDLVATTTGFREAPDQGRADPNKNTGFVFQNCNLSPSASYSVHRARRCQACLQVPLPTGSIWEGPWKTYYRTIFLDSCMGQHWHHCTRPSLLTHLALLISCILNF